MQNRNCLSSRSCSRFEWAARRNLKTEATFGESFKKSNCDLSSTPASTTLKGQSVTGYAVRNLQLRPSTVCENRPVCRGILYPELSFPRAESGVNCAIDIGGIGL